MATPPGLGGGSSPIRSALLEGALEFKLAILAVGG